MDDAQIRAELADIANEADALAARIEAVLDDHEEWRHRIKVPLSNGRRDIIKGGFLVRQVAEWENSSLA